MNASGPDYDDSLLRWFAEAADGTISPEDLAKLENTLATSAQARSMWFVFNDMEIGLADWSASRACTPENTVLAPVSHETPLANSRKHPGTRHRHPLRAFFGKSTGIAAAAVILLGCVVWLFSGSGSPDAIATLTRSHNATWLSGALSSGDTIPSPRIIDLTSGMVEFEMSSGTRIVFEGPGRIELSSPNSVRLPSGRLHATVPPRARGFLIIGQGFQAIDHGTEFGCSVPKDGLPELHVFKGSVEIMPHSGGSRMLQSNQAVAISKESLIPIQPKRGEFISPDSLTELLSNAANGIELARRQLKHHPQLKLYIDSAAVFDDSSLASGSKLHAIDCHTVPGRTPNLPALCFNGTTSRLEIDSKSTTPVATLIAWVQVYEPRRRQDLLSQDGPIARGEVAWYLNHGNAIGAGVLSPPLHPVVDGFGWQHSHAQNPPFSRDAWHLLATVLNAHSSTVTHYLDGVPISQESIKMPGFLKFDHLVIGAAPDSRNPNLVNRSFRGLIDEFVILSCALGSEEIQRIYQLGAPTAIPHP